MACFLDNEAVDIDALLNDSDDEDVADKLNESEVRLFLDDSSCENSIDYPNPYLSDSSVTSTIECAQRSKRPAESGTSPCKKGSPAVNWVFTLHNYTDNDEDVIKKLFPAEVSFLVYGREKTQSGVPHLQGFLRLKNKKRFAQVKRLFENDTVYIEKAKCGVKENVKYCTKGGDFEVFGEEQTKKKKMNEIFERLQTGCKISEIVESDLCHTYVVHEKKIKSVLKDIQDEKSLTVLQDRHERMMSLQSFRPWQAELMQEISKQKNAKDTRTVNWVYDRAGNTGKSYFCKNVKLADMDNVCLLENGTKRDIAYLYNGEKLVLFDFGRVESEYINYEVIEKIKSGFIFSTKYEPKMKMYGEPIVVCFSNFVPDVRKLSMDRWNILELVQETYIVMNKRNASDFA